MGQSCVERQGDARAEQQDIAQQHAGAAREDQSISFGRAEHGDHGVRVQRQGGKGSAPPPRRSAVVAFAPPAIRPVLAAAPTASRACRHPPIVRTMAVLVRDFATTRDIPRWQ